MSQIKECFPSRFKNGVILETDFSQLEVIGLAALSHDPVLIQDLLDGRDMHRFFAALLFGIPEDQVTKHQRSIVKKFTFALQYGSGANGLAKKNGTSVDVAQAFIDTYYDRYKGVKHWQDTVYNEVIRSRVVTQFQTPAGYPKGRGEYESVTGRIYTFFEQDKPATWRGEDKSPSFTPPEIKNYPVQGFATGDLMALFRARVLRWWVTYTHKLKALPINTVHDNVVFDCETKKIALEVDKELKRIAATLQAEVKRLWDIDAPVPFKVESTLGPTWADQTGIK